MATPPFFTDYSPQTPIAANWLNYVSNVVYSLSNTGTGGGGGASFVGYDGTTLDQILMLRLNRVVDSVAQLRTLSKLVYQRAFGAGYYQPHDEGGGAYQLDPLDSTSADNGCTIIVAADGGRWKLQLTGPLSVKQGGAYGDNSHDDTVAINNCLATGLDIYVPPGQYLVSATLNGQLNQVIKGGNANTTIFQRTGNYGDTLYFANAGAARVEGIWFNHSTFYVAGQTSIPNLATSGAHVHMKNGQQARVANCFMWRLQYGIHFDGVTLSEIENNWIQGVWDGANVGCQEGVANIWLDNTTANCQIIKIYRNYLTGAKSAARSVTWTAGDGSTTATVSENIGSQYGLLIFGCEDLAFEKNFAGANQAATIQASMPAAAVCLDWRFTGNFFDDGPTHGQAINFTSPSNTYVNGVTISGNVFNGELVGFQAIAEFSAGTGGTAPAMTNFSITGNTFQANIGTAINLYGAVGGVISGNSITGYNCRGTSAGADVTFCAAVNLNGASEHVHVHGNNCGGAVGSAGVFGANTHLAIANTGSNLAFNYVHDNVVIAGGAASNQVGDKEFEPTLLTSTANYQALASDRMCIMAMVRSAAWSFGLPANPPRGKTITLKDGVGQSSTFGVQVIGVVDGVTNPNYTTNYFSKTFLWNDIANQWNVIAN